MHEVTFEAVNRENGVLLPYKCSDERSCETNAERILSNTKESGM